MEDREDEGYLKHGLVTKVLERDKEIKKSKHVFLVTTAAVVSQKVRILLTDAIARYSNHTVGLDRKGDDEDKED